MTLEKLQADMITAMKNRNPREKEVLSSLVSAVKKFGIDNLCKDNMTEEQVDAVILKEKKTLQEMIDTCPDTRLDLKSEYEAKMVILMRYAPFLREDPEDIKSFVESLGIELVKANRGKIMAALKGKADMKIANQVVGQMLQQGEIYEK